MHDHDLMTTAEVAKRLRVDIATVRRWIQGGLLEAVTLPHAGKRERYRIRRETIQSVLNGKEQEKQDDV